MSARDILTILAPLKCGRGHTAGTDFEQVGLTDAQLDRQRVQREAGLRVDRQVGYVAVCGATIVADGAVVVSFDAGCENGKTIPEDRPGRPFR